MPGRRQATHSDLQRNIVDFCRRKDIYCQGRGSAANSAVCFALGITKADAVTRSTKPYADMTFGFGSRGNPAICMTHHAAMEYCRWISAKTGKNYRLPTEAEWEYAARAGAATAYSFGNSPEELGEYAWYVENAEKPMPIGKKKPNPWGLYDIHGNVAEWCSDWYGRDYYRDGPSRDPAGPESGQYRVARGGCWHFPASAIRSSSRNFFSPVAQDSCVGFRVARTAS